MTRPLQLTVDADGCVTIPGTQPGQTVSITIDHASDMTEQSDTAGPIPEEECAAIKARVKQRAQEIRKELPEPWLSADHGDLLYGDDGLPK